MIKKSIIIFVNTILVVLMICGCNKEVENDEISKIVKKIDNELPRVEYIDEQLLEKSLWINISQFCNNENYENKRDVIVALIDIGISEYYTNSSYLYTNYNEIAGNNIDDDGNGYIDDINGWNVIDNNGNIINYNENSIHASAILGMLIGENEYYNYYGMLTNSSVKIVPVKALDDDNISGSVENVIKAVEYAEAINADIVAMSFSTYVNSQELEEAISSSDMLFVVAAGNEGKELCEEYKVYPACYENSNIITVAALSNTDEIDYSSNYGRKYVDIATWGENVVCYLGDNKFVYEGGTSFAVPFVVAEAAIIACSSELELSSTEIKSIIMENVCYNELLKEKVSSEGILNIDRLWSYLE